MLFLVYEFLFLFCKIAPEHKNEVFSFFREQLYDTVGELFPADVAV